jgi:hypothetical protein
MHRTLMFIMSSLVVAALVSAALLAGQEKPHTSSADPVQAFIAARTAPNWTPPRTPWGDPDIQGNFTNKDEANTPFERPEKWAGRRIDEITAEELAADIVERQQRAVEQAPFAGGGEPEEGVAIAVPIHWFDNLAARNARPWFVIDPPDGKVPAIAGQAAGTPAPPALGREDRLRGGRRDSYTDRSLGDRCIAFGLWRTPGIYGNSYQLLQTPDHVVLRYEMIHEARVIPIDGRAHPQPGLNRHMGDSVGHWEGSSLVVETRNIHPQMNYRGRSSRNQRLVERFTRIGPRTVEWTATIDDPTVWPQPWTYSIPMTEDDKQIIYEYACHEGNYGLANLLSAGRADEKKAPRATR